MAEPLRHSKLLLLLIVTAVFARQLPRHWSGFAGNEAGRHGEEGSVPFPSANSHRTCSGSMVEHLGGHPAVSALLVGATGERAELLRPGLVWQDK